MPPGEPGLAPIGQGLGGAGLGGVGPTEAEAAVLPLCLLDLAVRHML